MTRTRFRTPTTLAIVIAVLAGFLVGLTVVATSAQAIPTAPASRSTTGVTADALPTVQIDGVAWSQAIVGNTVYVAGNFANARPAGAAPGTNLTPRANLLAYNLTTGNLITSFAPSLNAAARVVTASPDGTRIYVGGSFTTANGQPRYRIAAYDTATGALINSFAPTLDYDVNAIVATNTTVYVGGGFGSANNVARNRLAAFNASDGSLTGWAPSADNNEVEAMVMAPGGAKIVVGGSFTSINGSSSAYGLGAVDPTTGALVPWATTNVVQDAGTASAILSLSTDGTNVYGTGYVFGAGGNLEGTFASDPTGNLKWVEDCHGDTYSAFGVNGTVYTVSHNHFCGNVGGFPETLGARTFHRTVAFTANATGTLLHNTVGGYNDFGGQPSPSIVNWFPDLDAGSFTGQDQAAWDVSGNSQYILMGGEFPAVNGTPQQGLVRFGVPSVSTPKQGPMNTGANFVPTLRPVSSTSVRVSWPANWDRDDQNLTYHVVRNGDINHPIYTTTATSQVWNTPVMGMVDTGLSPGTNYTYRLNATDPDGHLVWGDTVSITTPTNSNPSNYAQRIPTDNAASYYRLDETSGTTARDSSGAVDLTEGSGVTKGAAGAIIGDSDTASSFSGTSSGFASTTSQIAAPNSYSLETWFKTNTTSGGKLIGFGDASSGNSSQTDRQVYMDNAGHLVYGVYQDGTKVLTTSATYNDNNWHQVVATLSGSGMVLYVDGAQVASNSAVTVGRPAYGYWRVGGDTLSGWPSTPSSGYFRGTLDDVAIYPAPLTLSQVQNHFVLSGRTLAGGTNAPPTASFTSSCPNLSCAFDGSGSTDSDGTIASYAWNFGDNSTGTGVKPSHTYAAAGTYTVTLTVTDNLGATNAVSKSVTVTAPNQPPTAAFTPTCTNLGCSFDATASTDSDGTIASYAWNFGDNSTGTGVKPSHTYAAAGTYTVTLTVTDNQGATNAVSKSITVTAPNQPPTAAFTPTCTNLACSFDASASKPGTGATISSYAWTFGDGSTGTGVKPSHTYAAAGSYSVKLTVTDSAAKTASTTQTVVVSTNPTLIADNFTRTVTNGWGTANTGGTWNANPPEDFAVANGVGTTTLSAPGAGASASLDTVSQANLNLLFDTGLNKAATGNGVFVTVMARENSTGDYRFKVRYMGDGTIHLVLSKVVAGNETTLQEVAVSGLTYTAGTMLRARFQISGSGTTTLSGRVWPVGSAEPASAQITMTDNQSGLQTAGSFGLQTYLAGNATNAPMTVSVDNISATAS